MNKMIWSLLVLQLPHLPLFAQQFWQRQNSNFPSVVSVTSLSAVNNQVCWALGQIRPPGTTPYPGYIRTTDGGNTWVCDSIPGAEGGLLQQIDALDANTAYATAYVLTASNSKGVYRTTDGGTTWTKQNAYASSLLGAGYIHFFDANNGVVIGDPNLETYTTTNGGLNWNPVSMPPSLAGEYTKLSDAGIASRGNCVWFSTGAHIFRSTDKGYTWSASPPEPLYSSWYPCIAFQDSNNGIYALKLAPGGIDHLYRKTTDGGVTWATLSNPIIDSIAPSCIQYLPGSRATYLVAGGMPQGKRGFACTYNAGKDWSLIDTSGHLCIAFPSPTVGWGSGLAYVSNDVYRFVGPPLSVEHENIAPAWYRLAQNYPNPFNPSTTITFGLPKAGHVSLGVFDLLGREISELVNERRDAGVYDVKFDGSNLASGVYIYRLQAGSFVQSKKLVLLH